MTLASAALINDDRSKRLPVLVIAETTSRENPLRCLSWKDSSRGSSFSSALFFDTRFTLAVSYFISCRMFHLSLSLPRRFILAHTRTYTWYRHVILAVAFCNETRWRGGYTEELVFAIASGLSFPTCTGVSVDDFRRP